MLIMDCIEVDNNLYKKDSRDLIDLAINSPAPVSMPVYPTKKKKETSMNYASAAIVATADTTERDQRNHLLSRLHVARYLKKRTAREAFKIEADESPKNPKELAQRIADGKFIIKDADSDKNFHWYGYGWSTFIEWRDPAHPADEAGYKEFKNAMSAKYQAAEDIIKILPVAEGLKALQEFEAWEFTASKVH